MIVNATRVIAYKCPYCGTFVNGEFSLFEILPNKIVVVECTCGEASVKISRPNKGYMFEIPCIACEGDHQERVQFKELWSNEETYILCPESGFGLCCIGSHDVVRKWVEDYDDNMEMILGQLGFDDYFVNDAVMLEAVDKIHDIAEKGNLYCKCGALDIEMELLYDRIVLFCPKCSAEKVIVAETDEDIEEFLKCEEIVLVGGGNGKKAKVVTLKSLKD